MCSMTRYYARYYVHDLGRLANNWRIRRRARVQEKGHSLFPTDCSILAWRGPVIRLDKKAAYHPAKTMRRGQEFLGGYFALHVGDSRNPDAANV